MSALIGFASHRITYVATDKATPILATTGRIFVKFGNSEFFLENLTMKFKFR